MKRRLGGFFRPQRWDNFFACVWVERCNKKNKKLWYIFYSVIDSFREVRMYTAAIESVGVLERNVSLFRALSAANQKGGLVIKHGELVAFYCSWEHRMKPTKKACWIVRGALE